MESLLVLTLRRRIAVDPLALPRAKVAVLMESLLVLTLRRRIAVEPLALPRAKVAAAAQLLILRTPLVAAAIAVTQLEPPMWARFATLTSLVLIQVLVLGLPPRVSRTFNTSVLNSIEAEFGHPVHQMVQPVVQLVVQPVVFHQIVANVLAKHQPDLAPLMVVHATMCARLSNQLAAQV